MIEKIWGNIKLVLSILGTIFGHPVMMIIGSFLTADLEFEIKSIVLPLIMIILAFIRYLFFYFWNYERIKHLTFVDGFKFFTRLQLFQIFFILLYPFLQIHDFKYGGEGIVLLFYSIFLLLPSSIFVLIFMQIKLHKYKKFDLNKEG